MAKINLEDVQVTRVFWQGKGAQVTETYKTREGERQTRYALFFDEPHGLTEGTIINVNGLLSATVDEFEKRDGSTGHAINFKINSPRVSDVRGATLPRTESPVNDQWPNATLLNDGAPF